MDKNSPTSMKEAFSYTTTVNGTQWDPTRGTAPFNVMSGTGYIEDMLKGFANEEERRQKSDRVLPFPLDRIVDQLVTNFIELTKTRQTLITSYKTALLSDEEKALLKADVKKITKCMDTIKEISKDIEKMKFGY